MLQAEARLQAGDNLLQAAAVEFGSLGDEEMNSRERPLAAPAPGRSLKAGGRDHEVRPLPAAARA